MTSKKHYTEEITSFLKTAALSGQLLDRIDLMPSRTLAAKIFYRNGASFFLKKHSPESKNGDQWFQRLGNGEIGYQVTIPTHAKRIYVDHEWSVFENLEGYDRLSNGFCPNEHSSLAVQLATELGKFHSTTYEIASAIRQKLGPGASAQSAVRPLGALTTSEYADTPGLDRDRYLSAAQAAAPSLARLKDDLLVQCAVHGDLQGGNILLGPADSFAVIDWDYSGLGDPRWDLGYVVATLILSWLKSETKESVDLAGFLANSEASWRPFREWLNTFLTEYEAAGGQIPNSTDDSIVVFWVAGHALLTRARNFLAFRGQYSPREILSLTLAEKFLCSTDQCVQIFLSTARQLINEFGD